MWLFSTSWLYLISLELHSGALVGTVTARRLWIHFPGPEAFLSRVHLFSLTLVASLWASQPPPTCTIDWWFYIALHLLKFVLLSCSTYNTMFKYFYAATFLWVFQKDFFVWHMQPHVNLTDWDCINSMLSSVPLVGDISLLKVSCGFIQKKGQSGKI